ncbi:MAG: type II secretion system protein [Rhodoferax sp.]|nr:type II secretion system protein [Rhodoferax sp.]
MHSKLRQQGFTLIELVMVIVIMGVIGGIVAVFMKSPIDAYFDTARRAALTDVADTTVRRMARDIRKALPNSIRQLNSQCIEFIPTKTGGRYRAEETVAGDGTSLNFSATDTTFNMLGDNGTLAADQQIAAGDLIAVYNLGIAGSDAYAGDNTSVVSSVANGTETVITIASKKFPLASGSNRFHVVPGSEKVVAYICDGSGNLLRNANYAYTTSSTCPTAGATVMANKIAACNFVYNGSDLQRNALVQLGITFAEKGESVNLYHEVHVNNTP